MKQKPQQAELTPQAQQATENSTIIVGRKVNGKWQIAVLLNGIFDGTATNISLDEAMNEALTPVFERRYKDGDRIQFKIDVVSE